MLTGKQRSYLKGLAHELEPVVMIGKSGVSESVVTAIDDALSAHELVKVAIVGDTELDPKVVANEMAGRLRADFVQAIGHKFVLYRMPRDPRDRKIVLPRAR
ncbi:MAG: ribosome assembly RNA-binding protein YhbY [Eubacterium sp.]|nr:ribosome assembly RNA-binding protein YhbY [Eubacterium sp.]